MLWKDDNAYYVRAIWVEFEGKKVREIKVIPTCKHTKYFNM